MSNKLNSVIQALLMLEEDEEDDDFLILLGMLVDHKRRKERMSQVSSSENEIKVFCPKCNTQVSHTAKGIPKDQTKILIAKVYHYFEQEYEELKKLYRDLDLTPLSKFRQRTALATGVSETTLLQILKEEEGRNADRRWNPPQERRAARKRRRQADSSSEEDSPDDNVDDIEQPIYMDEAKFLGVKQEPPECNNEEPEIFLPADVKLELSDDVINKEQMDPISVDMKTEPRDDEIDTSRLLEEVVYAQSSPPPLSTPTTNGKNESQL